jgi:hypothetical protein
VVSFHVGSKIYITIIIFCCELQCGASTIANGRETDRCDYFG